MNSKRIFDLFVGGLIISATFPILLVTAILIYFMLGSPILFRQVRPGHHKRPFKLIKFRTMTSDKDKDGFCLPDKRRITHFGKILRSSSIDELPEFWNVLKGDMSLVGPRPLLMEYLPLYNARQARRHEVKPGLTGWAQVNGRNALSWEEKFELDVWYVDHQSLCLDLKIIGLTMWKILKREGIRHPGHATTEEFTGNR
jgi:sugar transferase EpsL